MKKLSKNKNRKVARKRPLRLIAILAAIAIIASAAVTVLSRQHAASAMANDNAKNSVTLRVGGQDIHVNGQTGEVKPLTQEEIQKMVGAMKKMANQSTEGLSAVRHEDGSLSMDLGDRFQNVTIARQNKDGSVTTSCVDNPTSAARFFEAKDDSSDNPANANRIQPVRRANQ